MRSRLRVLSRNAVAVLALLGYLTAALGVPMPAPSDPPPVAAPEPTATEVHPCGCVVSDCGGPCCCCGEAAPVEQAPSDTGMIWLVGEQVRKCHGMESLWLSVGIALPLPPPVNVDQDEPPLCRLALSFTRLDTLSSAPPAPPPRV
jgi:hypothetical protein